MIFRCVTHTTCIGTVYKHRECILLSSNETGQMFTGSDVMSLSTVIESTNKIEPEEDPAESKNKKAHCLTKAVYSKARKTVVCNLVKKHVSALSDIRNSLSRVSESAENWLASQLPPMTDDQSQILDMDKLSFLIGLPFLHCYDI